MLPRTLSPLEWMIVCASLVAWAFFIYGGHVFVPDDVFFYLKIAGAIVSGQGSTFNGITPTNGYHPLWMVLLLPLRLVISDRQGLIRALFALCAVLYVAALFLLARLLDRLRIRARWPALALFAYYVLVNPLGSEFHISLPLLLLFLLKTVPLFEGSAGDRDWILAGVIAGLGMLARLDNVFLIGLVIAAATLSGPRFFRHALLIGVPAVIVVAPYLLWNKLAFGAFQPISGVIKSTFVHAGLMKLGMQALGLACGALSLPFARHTRLFVALACAAGVHVTYLALRMDGSWSWYFASELIASCLAASLWMERVEAAGAPRLVRSALPLAIVLLLFVVVGVRRAHNWTQAASSAWYVEAGRVIDEIVPPGEGIATTVSPGGIAYFSDRPVLAFDGLTLDFSYHRDAAQEGLAAYLQRRGIRYLFNVAADSREALDFAARTRREGQVEDTAYHLAADGRSVDSLTIESGYLARPLGEIPLAHLPLLRRHFCTRDVAIWQLAAL